MGWRVKVPGSSSQIEVYPPPGIFLFGMVPSFLIVYWEMARGTPALRFWNFVELGRRDVSAGKVGSVKSRYILRSQVPLVFSNSTLSQYIFLRGGDFARISRDVLGTGGPRKW